jgi:hypothetical protein
MAEPFQFVVSTALMLAYISLWIDCGTSLREFHLKDYFTVPEDASYYFIGRSLLLEFVFPSPPCNPNLAPSAFHLLALRGRHFAEDGELKREELRRFSHSACGASHTWKKNVSSLLRRKIMCVLYRGSVCTTQRTQLVNDA